MPAEARPPSARQEQLLERAYDYVLEHGLAGMSLRPLADAIGSSPRVLLFLFGSKEALVRALLDRARRDETAMLERSRSRQDLADVLRVTWDWLAREEHRRLLVLWVEAFGMSLTEPKGPWAGFAERSVQDWLALLADAQGRRRHSASAAAERTLVLAVLRGALLDLLSTGDAQRTTAAVHLQSRLLQRS